jgi:hypothetical protein
VRPRDVDAVPIVEGECRARVVEVRHRAAGPFRGSCAQYGSEHLVHGSEPRGQLDLVHDDRDGVLPDGQPQLLGHLVVQVRHEERGPATSSERVLARDGHL